MENYWESLLDVILFEFYLKYYTKKKKIEKFFFDKNKVPFYDVPDLKDFKVIIYLKY